MKAINLSKNFEKLSDYWSPKIIAEMNDYQFKLVRARGKFIWHTHEDTDETFIVLDGKLTIEFRDRLITLKKGEMAVVPMGVEHRPVAQNECKVMIVEPRGVVKTGNAGV
mgnify:CR=1 FL=1